MNFEVRLFCVDDTVGKLQSVPIQKLAAVSKIISADLENIITIQ